ncbi:MAG: ShlB/FhaC/HecB family hemolysin secretion/activation protein [Planctomycetota bacterium]
MNGYIWKKWFSLLCCVVFCFVVGDVKGESADITETAKTEAQLKLEEKAKEEKQEKLAKPRMDISPEEIAKLSFPEDTSQLMTAKELVITGNNLISTEEILSSIPLVFNASAAPLQKAASADLYDLRPVRDLIENPGQPCQITARTIRGLTQCILGIYKNKGYSGIFVAVPPDALEGGKLRDDVLLIKVTEAVVSSVTTSYFTPENVRVGKGYLSESFLRKWTPFKEGEVGKQKQLEEYVNLLNLNPDRYISATVSKGAEPNTLSVGYNVYEANPWHWFVQVDNAGTEDRQWAPRVGLINTNLLGFDDTLTIYHQAPWDSGFTDNYSVYGSYDFPLLGPALRLKLFAAYSDFDVTGGGGIDFLGHGYVYGGELRYNVFQTGGWFFDVKSSLSYEESKVSSSIFSSILGSKVDMDLWGVGVDLHRRTDMANTSITFDRVDSVGGSDQSSFWDSATLTGARTNAEKDFVIYTTAASHTQYLDPAKVQRLSASLRWIEPTERLVPAKMTTFGGMYTVRGYKESRIVADGGILASVQYEFDLVRHGMSVEESRDISKEKPFLRKLAPLVFFDYGQAIIKSPVAGEDKSQDLYSVGPGLLTELGDNFVGAVYYGFPLEDATGTEEGKGRLNVSLMMRW